MNNSRRLLSALFLLLLMASCKPSSAPEDDSSYNDHDELLQDQKELEEAYLNQKKIANRVFATIETEPVAAQSEDDAADDPAVWLNQNNPAQSIVFGSNKKGGIVAYDLQGQKLEYYEVGNVNNVDIIYDIPHDGRSIDLLGASNRSSQGIDLFEITQEGKLMNLSDDRFLMDTTIVDDIYGFCFGRSSEGQHYALINGKNGLVRQYLLESIDGALQLQLVREIQLESQPEGMVVSEGRQSLYIGEEQKGIWLVDLNPDSTAQILLPNSGEENEYISYDIEGLSILKTDGIEWLIASSQGNFSYAVFDIADNHQYLGSFIISDGDHIDGAEETDGIDLITDSLSQQFPHGVFIAQDGFNYDGASQVPQNFKYVDLGQILNLFE